MKDKQTIAQFLKVKAFPFVIKDDKGNVIYYENSDGYWAKREYDAKGNEIYYENSSWSRCTVKGNRRLSPRSSVKIQIGSSLIIVQSQ